MIALLETIPTLNVGGVPVIDVPAVLARHPQVALVDGLVYDNPAGSRHRHRYEDVEELLESGISVMTSINLEYIAEQQDFVRSFGQNPRTKPSRRHSSIAPTRWSWSTHRRKPRHGSRRTSAARCCASARYYWWQMSSTDSSSRTCEYTVSNRPGARRSGFSSA